MDDNISKFQEIKLLLAFIKHSDGKGNVHSDKTEIAKDLRENIWNGN